MNRQILVLPDGNISFPLAGQIQAAGQTVGQLRGTLISRLSPNFAAPPTVFVGITAVARTAARSSGPSQIEVFLMGEVQQPGRRQVPADTTILEFLAETGGFTKFAAKKRIQLRRTMRSGEVQTYTINYRNIERGRDVQTATSRLQAGDIIVVPERRLFE